MRGYAIGLACLLVLATGAAAWAVQEGDMIIAPEVGFAAMNGELGRLLGGDIAYGVTLAYGVIDWLAIEADTLYSLHEQADKGETGEISTSHFIGGIGPRFNWNTRYVIPYLTLQGAASFLRLKSEWEGPRKTLKDQNDAHAFGGLGGLGVDFLIADAFTVGLFGKAGYLKSNLEYSDKQDRDQEAGAYGYFAGGLRLTMIF